MKEETLHTLIVARTLFDQIDRLSPSEDEHSASAALLVLQDAVELVLLASLTELGIDKNKNIHSLSFESLIGELRSAKVTVPKSGTLNALNKTRVVVKHYGQLAEPKSVRNYISASKLAVDVILMQVVSANLQSIMLHQLLPDGEAKDLLSQAALQLHEKEYFAALASIRKALFVEVEIDYVIEEWSDEENPGPLAFLMKKGVKAPYYKRNKKWISQNVREPFDFIQIDHESIRLDLLEWGANTQDYWNLWRMTPKVFRSIGSDDWLIKLNADRDTATQADVQYCLDRAVSLISKKKLHSQSARHYRKKNEAFIGVTAMKTTPVFQASDVNSTAVHVLEEGESTKAESYLVGLDGRTFFEIFDVRQGEEPIAGYALADDLKIDEAVRSESTQGVLNLPVERHSDDDR